MCNFRKFSIFILPLLLSDNFLVLNFKNLTHQCSKYKNRDYEKIILVNLKVYISFTSHMIIAQLV